MKANLLIRGRAIFDSISEKPYQGYVAIGGNRIIAAGKGEPPSGLSTKQTKTIEAGNKLVMPGFHDSHTHLVLAGMYKKYVNLGAARSEQEASEMLMEYEKANPTEGWLYGFNWYHVFWNSKNLPTKKSLDRLFPDRPVFLVNAEAHGAWVNSKALKLTGVSKKTPDPFGGKVGRLDNGEPSGFLYESAVGYVAPYCLSFSYDQERSYVKAFMKRAAALGITALVDVQPYFSVNMGNLDSYLSMEQNGELTLRIHAAPDLFGDLDRAAEAAAKCSGSMVRADLLKQFVDGVFTTHTALMLEDYSDAPGNRGIELCELDRIETAVMEAHKRELSVKLHALGDRAIRFALDCYEKAIAVYGENSSRHAIEHVELADVNDIKRFGALGIIPSVQPEHIGLMPTWDGEEYRYVLGEERAGRTWPLKSLLQSAGVLALGSDCPVVDNNPFFGIHRGLTRLHDDGLPEGGWNPTEKLSLPELIKGYTHGSAYGVKRENELGTLEAGKLADLIIIDRNLFEVLPEEIRQAKVILTVVDGKIVHEVK